MLDALILEFDRALRTVAGVHRTERASPAAGVLEGTLDAVARAEAAALMRVNHVGEVCAQALYQGQALTAREPGNRRALARLAIAGAWRSSPKPSTRSKSIFPVTSSACPPRTAGPGPWSAPCATTR